MSRRRAALTFLAMMVAVSLVLFPNLQRSEVELVHEIPACVEHLEVDIFREGTLVRGYRRLVDAPVLRQKVKLARGPYRVVSRLDCRGSRTFEEARALEVDDDGVIQFKAPEVECGRCEAVNPRAER